MAKIEERKGSKIFEVIKKDYPGERILLGVLGIIVIVFGIYIIGGVRNPETGWLVIRNREGFFAFFFSTDTKILIFSWVIIVVGVIAFGMAVWPFLRPSLLEMKRVSWPNSKTLQNHSARVYGFILFLVVMFLVYEFFLGNLFGWIRG